MGMLVGSLAGNFSVEWKGWTWGMWGNWVVSEWVVGVFGSNVGSHYCGCLSLWDIFMGIASSFIVFYFVLIVKKGQGLWASRNEWNNL